MNAVGRPPYTTFDHKQAVLGYIPGFLPKHARPNHKIIQPTIHDFRSVAKEPDEKLICPLRALNIYYTRSCKYAKQNEKRMFLTFGSNKKGSGATKMTMARWLKETIQFAYESAGESDYDDFNAHSTR